AIEIELLDGGWEDRQILAVVAARPWQSLHERGVDAPPFDRRRHRSLHVNQREQFGIRKTLAERLQDLLAAAHARQPVVDESKSQGSSLKAQVSRRKSQGSIRSDFAVDLANAPHGLFP